MIIIEDYFSISDRFYDGLSIHQLYMCSERVKLGLNVIESLAYRNRERTLLARIRDHCDHGFGCTRSEGISNRSLVSVGQLECTQLDIQFLA